MVNHTIGMAKDLHLQVIAEGVETKAHVDFLKNSNCDIAQDFILQSQCLYQSLSGLLFNPAY